jgi:homoserine kinase
MEGERAASGTPHADNVAPSVMGGIVLIRSYEPFEAIALPVPERSPLPPPAR